MIMVYLAHPVRGGISGNIEKAKRWIEFFGDLFDIAIVAPWITEVEIWDDSNPRERERGMRRNLEVVSRCDEVWAVGCKVGRPSSGMAEEIRRAKDRNVPVYWYGLRPELVTTGALEVTHDRTTRR